jgi:PncC family amidohydrolase
MTRPINTPTKTTANPPAHKPTAMRNLPASLIHLLNDHRRTLATAESCTGGLIAKILTDVPGASSAYLGGWVVYSNAMKNAQLNVPRSVLRHHGAVSRQVAVQLAQGAIRHTGADFSLAVTGIAGPQGGTPRKPVGTVWLALGIKPRTPKNAKQQTHSRAVKRVFTGNRNSIRIQAATYALTLLHDHLSRNQ